MESSLQATPAPSAPPSMVQRLRRVGFIVLAIDFVLLGVLGTWLAFNYEPGGSTISTLHTVLGAIAVLAAFVAAVATAADPERSTAGVLPAVVVLGLVGGMYLIGPTLAWDGLAVGEGGIGDAKGVTVVFDDDVQAVAQGEEQLSAGQYRRFAWLHTLALPLAVVIMGAAGVWAARRRNRYVPRRVATGPPAS